MPFFINIQKVFVNKSQKEEIMCMIEEFAHSYAVRYHLEETYGYCAKDYSDFVKIDRELIKDYLDNLENTK